MRKRITIIGAGFAGLSFLKKFLTLMSPEEKKEWEITLVSRTDYFLFTPRLLDLLSGQCEQRYAIRNFADIAFLQESCVQYYIDTVEKINLEKRVVHTQKGREISYDILVLTSGAYPNYFGVSGAQDHALTFKVHGDIDVLHTHVRLTLERAEQAVHDEERKRWLRYVIVGAGPTGVELMFKLRETVLRAIAERTRQGTGATNIPTPEFIIVQRDASILTGFSQKLIHTVEERLRELNISVRTNFEAIKVERDRIISKRESIEAETIFWTAGVRANRCAVTGDVTYDEIDRAVTNKYCQLENYREVFLAGDSARSRDPHTDKPYLPTAQVAMQQGEFIGAQVYRYIHGRSLHPFTYQFKGTIITLDDSRAAMQLGRNFVIKGRFPHWLRHILYNKRFTQVTG